MARVVQQRTGPPYFLIIMVFLFFVASILAVLFHLEGDKLKKSSAKTAETLKKVAGRDDLQDAKIVQMIKRYDTPEPGERRGITVVKRLEGKIETLTQLITGTTTTAEGAADKADAAFREIKSRRGLVSEVLDLFKQRNALQADLKDRDSRIRQKTDELAEKSRLVERLTKDFEGKIAAQKEQVDLLEARLTAAHEKYQKDLEQAREEWQRQRDELNKNIVVKTRQIAKLQRQLDKMKQQIANLRDRIREAQPRGDPMKVARTPDGKVMSVVQEQEFCYISLGSKDRVTPGLTFTVYPPTGIPADGKGKASIVVAEVGEDTSGCRIVQQDRDDPIVDGDVIANLAFDPTRTYTFVVEGVFDLHGKGRATSEGAEEARALIKQFGGKVARQVSIDTDFLILGTEPARPQQPPEGAPSQVWQAYRDQLKIYERFNETMADAQNLQVPVLNTNKFLAFIGYTPGG